MIEARTLKALFAAAAIATASLGVVLVTAVPASAQSSAAKASVDVAKASGVVGEQADGFLGVVSSADPAVAEAVAEINAGRAEAYRTIATRTGVTPDAAGQATARELLSRLAPGQMYRTANGGWRRK